MPESVAALRVILAGVNPDTGQAWADAAQLREYVGASTADDAYLGRCWAQATALVGTKLLPTVERVESVPPDLLARACIETGSELFHRRQAPHGVTNFADDATMPVRVARDPLVSARPILSSYLGGGFA